jgi:hypothetical protein
MRSSGWMNDRLPSSVLTQGAVPGLRNSPRLCLDKIEHMYYTRDDLEGVGLGVSSRWSTHSVVVDVVRRSRIGFAQVIMDDRRRSNI